MKILLYATLILSAHARIRHLKHDSKKGGGGAKPNPTPSVGNSLPTVSAPTPSTNNKVPTPSPTSVSLEGSDAYCSTAKAGNTFVTKNAVDLSHSFEITTVGEFSLQEERQRLEKTLIDSIITSNCERRHLQVQDIQGLAVIDLEAAGDCTELTEDLFETCRRLRILSRIYLSEDSDESADDLYLLLEERLMESFDEKTVTGIVIVQDNRGFDGGPSSLIAPTNPQEASSDITIPILVTVAVALGLLIAFLVVLSIRRKRSTRTPRKGIKLDDEDLEDLSNWRSVTWVSSFSKPTGTLDSIYLKDDLDRESYDIYPVDEGTLEYNQFSPSRSPELEFDVASTTSSQQYRPSIEVYPNMVTL